MSSTVFVRPFSRVARALLAGFGCLSLSMLGGCYFVTDTQRMNTEVFAAQTAPTWNQPMAAPPTEKPNKFLGLFKTPFHQTYGMPAAEPYVSPFATPMQKAIYGQMSDDGHTLTAIPLDRVDKRFLRQEVDYPTTERPGTIVVDTKAHYLYLVEANGRAMRYGVGLGKQGFAWQGRGVLQFKKTWPRWTPSDDMVERQPDMRQFAAAQGGLEPGLRNPLGARALYIFQNGRDTLYRIHGTPDWQSVGKAVSSGCVRMFNQDVIDLYSRVRDKAEIVVM
ncbi:MULTISPECIES: L,D-transpeptidase [Rhizobium/Agrobacterium group]|uniref:L,D-transpeptidase family protein n=1 Tax=Agrobacterium vitis TaxID=373 RepID=A0ABD6HF23_AGRVI|nr:MULTISPECIES: L,D-transpeptidase [Rhizobium/Agrobacterium group]MCF1448363.1 L,D-transpeptidase [Allorhizobium ampelinum]MUO30372.1 L,D-transpeptidase family protein [Agrobacterium vitis]MUO45272.1 L,D-transpeptidase family protein [Agrobacterium vitis]MUP12177.1 L,D-transpeptidase family protein [Agrobacterium vitis]